MTRFLAPSQVLLPTLRIQPLAPFRAWINRIEVHQSWFARWVCRLVPNVCSRGYDLRCLGYTILHLPSLCKLNPLYDELLDLRFRAAEFLYEQSGSD